MTLCTLCAGVRFEDLFMGLAISWHSTILDLRASAEVCGLCALFVSAVDKPLLDHFNYPLYLAGTCKLRKGDAADYVPHQIQLVDVYVGVPDTGGLASGENASTQVAAVEGQLVYKDRRLRARIASLYVACGKWIHICPMKRSSRSANDWH